MQKCVLVIQLQKEMTLSRIRNENGTKTYSQLLNNGADMSRASPGFVSVRLHPAEDKSDTEQGSSIHSSTAEASASNCDDSSAHCGKKHKPFKQSTPKRKYGPPLKEPSGVTKSLDPEDNSTENSNSKVDQWLDCSYYYHVVPLAAAEELSDLNPMSEVDDDTALVEYGAGVSKTSAQLASITDEETEFSMSDTSLTADRRINGKHVDNQAGSDIEAPLLTADNKSAGSGSKPNYIWSTSVLEKHISSSSDLQKIILDEETKDDPVVKNLLDNRVDVEHKSREDYVAFAEHFFNVHRHSSGVVGVITKSVRFMHRHGNEVSSLSL